MQKPKTPLFGRFIKRGTTRTVFLVGPIAIKTVPALRLLRVITIKIFRHLFGKKAGGVDLKRWLYVTFSDVFIASCVANLSEWFVSLRCPILSAEKDRGHNRGFRIAKTYFSLLGLVNIQRRIRGSHPDYQQVLDALRTVGPKWQKWPGFIMQQVESHAFNECNWLQAPGSPIIALIDYGEAPKSSEYHCVSWVVNSAEAVLKQRQLDKTRPERVE